MQIDLTEFFSAAGLTKEMEVPFEQKEVCWNGEQYPVSEALPVQLTVTGEGGGVLSISGSARLTLEIPCGRCLTPVAYPFSLSFEHRIETANEGEEDTEATDEQPFVLNHLLDVDRLVSEELYVNMPMKVLCKPDCLGICPKCGCNRNIRDCGCDLFEPDPRMALIRDLFQGGGENGS